MPQAVILAFAAITSATICAADKSLAADSERYRSTNRYISVTVIDQPVCRSILRSLNKQYSFGEGQLNAGTNPNFVGDYLLKSDLEVAWHREPIKSGDVVDSVLDYASVDIANNGYRRTVYRDGGPDRGGSDDTLVISTVSPAELHATGVVDGEAVQRILNQGQYIEPNIVTTPEWRNKKDALPDLSDSFYFNIVKWKGKAYLLAMPYFAANAGDVVDVYVLKYVTENRMPMLCHFRSAVAWQRG